MKSHKIRLLKRLSCFEPLIAVSLLGVALGWLALIAPCSARESDGSTIQKAHELLEKGSIAEAESLLTQTVAANPQDHEAYYLLSKISLYGQDHKRAIKYAEKAIKINDSISDYHLWLARAYLAKAMESNVINAFRYARKGKGQYEKAVELDSSNVEALFELCMYLEAAPGLAGGDKDKSIKLASLIQKQDSLYGAYAWAGIWEHEGEVAKAESALSEAVRLDTSSSYYARYALGYFYERQERFDDAIKVFREILELDPDAMAALFQIGKIYLLTNKNLEEAAACFKRYLEIRPPPNAPSWAAAHWRLGMVYDLQGKLELAAEEVGKAIELDPENEQFRRTLRDIRKKLDAHN